jgi:hypothetical protein
MKANEVKIMNVSFDFLMFNNRSAAVKNCTHVYIHSPFKVAQLKRCGRSFGHSVYMQCRPALTSVLLTVNSYTNTLA